MTRHRPPEIPDEERNYEIGYRKPPAEHVFTKGVRANPSGRPKRDSTNGAIIQKMLSKLWKLRIDGKVVNITGREAVIRAQFIKAVTGDRRAAEFILRHWDDDETDLDPDSLSGEDRAIVRSFLQGLQTDPKSTARSLTLPAKGGGDDGSK